MKSKFSAKMRMRGIDREISFYTHLMHDHHNSVQDIYKNTSKSSIEEQIEELESALHYAKLALRQGRK